MNTGGASVPQTREAPRASFPVGCMTEPPPLRHGNLAAAVQALAPRSVPLSPGAATASGASSCPPVYLRSLPCRVCGATSDEPAVIDPNGPAAWCSFEHARQHGWPWLRSESKPGAARRKQEAPMPRELRISAIIEVPDGIWDQAERLSAARPIVEAFSEAVEKLGGKVEAELVVPRPRGEKGDSAAQYVAAGGKLPA